MLKKIIIWIITLIGITIGSEAVYLTIKYLDIKWLFGYEITQTSRIVFIIAGGLLFGIIFYFISPWLINRGRQSTVQVERMLQKVPTHEIIVGAFGLIVGLIIANLINNGPIKLIPIAWLSIILSITVYILLGYLGVSIATKKRDELLTFSTIIKKFNIREKEKGGKNEHQVRPKVLDTSVIIDGRIADIVNTGFVEGPLIIPAFVLEELRHIADSSDSLKRNRGRRGLDILNRIQKDMDKRVDIIEKDYEEVSEVDSKLLKLAQDIGGIVVTNDYNLNKVAEFQGVPVLNINELANAVKPIVLPGEEMIVQIVKDGKESGQGLAYLDDGTMIVVDGGKKFIGETINVIVTSVLQTAAGRMIFVKPKSAIDKVS